MGKITKINLEANKKLARLWYEKEIKYCELRFPGCLFNWLIQNAHRHKRWKYIKHPEKLSDFKQVIRACHNCHYKIENDKQLTEKVFNKLRGVDNLNDPD